MAPSAQAHHDPSLSQPQPNAPQPPQPQPNVAQPLSAPDLSNLQLSNLDQNQILSLLRHLPNVFSKLPEQGNPKEDAAQALSNLAAATHPVFGASLHYPPPPGASTGLPGINDPGPSSHPRGPPNLGQLSAVALQATPAVTQPRQDAGDDRNVQQLQQQQVQPVSAGSPMDEKQSTPPASGGSSGRRGRNPAMGSDEWSRQRKDNHKEVERRRRGNINEGINELGRIVPNGNGEKAKGAILARAVQYIHHLKENEARNIEKWTLEKLLMDQAMGDLQNQLEEVKRMWEEERNIRQRLEAEVENFRNSLVNGAANISHHQNDKPSEAEINAGMKRKSEDAPENPAEGDVERDGKRLRTE